MKTKTKVKGGNHGPVRHGTNQRTAQKTSLKIKTNLKAGQPFVFRHYDTH